MTMTFFFNVTDTGKKAGELGALCPKSVYITFFTYRFMVADRPVDIALLHHLPASRVLCWYNILRGGLDERYGAEPLERQSPPLKNNDITKRNTVS